MIPTERRRQLMLRVIDGRSENISIMYLFNDLRRCDSVLEWLVAHQITGLNFLHWFRVEAGNSPLEAMRLVLARIHKEDQRRVFAVRDLLQK